MTNTPENHICDKGERVKELETKVCRLEKDYKDISEKLNQLDKVQDGHSTASIRMESKMDNIERILKEVVDDRKSNKTFWRDKGVSLISTLMGGIILAYLLIRFGLK